MNADMQLYYDYTVSPLGSVFYRTLWRQLENIHGKRILDFGSGFAFTSNFLAQHNDVVALEMDASMIEMAEKGSTYEQIHGDLRAVKSMPDASYDMVTCHMVFEFVDNAQEILSELLRVLKKGGILSLVRHNRAGRMVQTVVQECDFVETKKLLEGGFAYSSAFGDIKYYENEDVLLWAGEKLCLEEVHGIRALASLHNGDVQRQAGWLETMLEIEWELLKNPAFVGIAYFNHMLLKKVA